MRVKIEDRIVELQDGDIFIWANYSENEATIGCNGNFLYITVDQFNAIRKLMLTHSSYSIVSGAEFGGVET